MKNIIQVKNLIKRYRTADKNAVDDISFEVKQGEFFALLGPNGAGKTTTISILTTTLSKTSGQILIDDLDLDKNQNQVRGKIGIIFQSPSLDINLTAEENIRFHAILYKLYPFRPFYSLMPQAYKNKVAELSHVLGIEEDIFKPIKTFSGGMKRKLEIIRSLIHQPKVLFLDEPTTGLDPISRNNLWQYLISVRKQQKTTIFLTTHYLEEAEEADHVCIINQGKIIAFGSPSRIKNELVQNYLILDAKDKKRLKAELDKLKLSYGEKENFIIDIPPDKMQNVIASIKTPLTVIKTHSPTLEEAYINIISKNNVS